MPTFIVGDKQIAIYQEKGRKKDGLFIFEKPNIWYKVGRFNNKESADHFIKYLNDMFERLQK